MQPTDFSEHFPGELVKTTETGWAYVPTPLPPELASSWELATALSAADQAIAELRGISERTIDPKLLIGPFLRREAELSSRIEGTITTQESLAEFDVNPDPGIIDQKNLEVSNHVKAVLKGLDLLENLPLSRRILLQVHEQLMKGVRGEEYTPGKFREQVVYIRDKGQTEYTARFVPPPPEQMIKCINEFETFINSPSPYPDLVNIALAHYQFETIHPFNDGNGRMGRTLITLMMCSTGTLKTPLLSLSPFFESHKDEYISRLFEVNRSGDWLPWVEFFLTAITVQAKDSAIRTAHLAELREKWRKQVQATTRSSGELTIIDKLFSLPAVTVPMARRVLAMSTTGARKVLDRLIEHGILTPTTSQSRRAKIYAAFEIIEVMRNPTDEQ